MDRKIMSLNMLHVAHSATLFILKFYGMVEKEVMIKHI